jgi:hypothetical protein
MSENIPKPKIFFLGTERSLLLECVCDKKTAGPNPSAEKHDQVSNSQGSSSGVTNLLGLRNKASS